ncbi:MAG: Uma2 family endonuclease [Saprospiraceae bacterium]|nr:Uma2 family endonuclease [Saprospiraceae bacterium]
MVAITGKLQKREGASSKKKPSEIPDHLIYEWLDGIPVYYREYKKVLSGELKFEEIMGYGSLQWYFVNLMKDYFQPIFGKTHWVWTGEGGLHVKHKSNPSLDFVILRKSDFSPKTAENKYLDKPPRVVIEIDTKADFSELPYSESEYYITKTEVLLGFGVEEVMWIFTTNQKVMVARLNQPWLTVNWTDEIEIMEHRFTLQSMMDSFELENEQK